MFPSVPYRMGTGEVTKWPPPPPISSSGCRRGHQGALEEFLLSEPLSLRSGASWSLGQESSPGTTMSVASSPCPSFLRPNPSGTCPVQATQASVWDDMGPRRAHSSGPRFNEEIHKSVALVSFWRGHEEERIEKWGGGAEHRALWPFHNCAQPPV